jgi:hypothetical protein
MIDAAAIRTLAPSASLHGEDLRATLNPSAQAKSAA